MSNKALITRRPETAAEPVTPFTLSAVQARSIVAEAETPAGVPVQGTESQFEVPEAAGFRVKLLPDTNLLCQDSKRTGRRRVRDPRRTSEYERYVNIQRPDG